MSCSSTCTTTKTATTTNRAKVKGLHRFHLTDSLFMEIAENMGIRLLSWKQLPLEDGCSGANRIANQSNADKDTDQIYGHLSLEFKGFSSLKSNKRGDDGGYGRHGQFAAVLGFRYTGDGNSFDRNTDGNDGS